MIRAAFLAFTLSAASASEKPGHVNALYGFRIEAPRADWIVDAGRDEATGGAKVTLASPKLAEGLVVTVHAFEAAGAPSPEKARQADVDFMQGKAEYDEPKIFDARIAGETATALEVLYRAPTAGDYVVRKLQLAHADLRYTIEAYAPAKEFAACEKDLARILASFEFVDVPDAEREKRGWVSLARQCGSEIEWAADWTDAARRAREQGRLVLASANFLHSFALEDQALTGPFLAPAVVALARARFVCLKLERGDDVPFASQASYGLGPHAFGVALLVVSPDGNVLDETACLQTQVVDRFLRDSLERHAAPQKDPGAPDGTPIEQAERHERRGELARARERVEASNAARAHLLRARCERRDGLGAEAFRAIEFAAQSDDAAGIAASIERERGLVLVGLGRLEEAEACFARLLARDPRDPAALYLRGACALMRGKPAVARASWQELVREQPGDRWAWAAAAALTGYALDMAVTWNPRFFEPALLRALRAVDARPLPPDRASDARAGAAAFLLLEQRADGSWTSPVEIRTYDTESPDAFVVACTALAGESLLGQPEQEGVRAAAERALGYLSRSIARAKGASDAAGFMDYEVWSWSLTLRFLARCSEAHVGQRDELRAAAKWLVGELRRKLRPGGGWSYYLTTDVAGGVAQDQQSISFVVGAVTLALMRAEETRLADARELVDGALGCLERMRGDDGVFAYMLGADDRAPQVSASPAGDAGRGPGCELALQRGKRSDPERVARALGRFRAHAAPLLRERGKVLMHCGPEGQGCHYILFDLWKASLAVAQLPAKERAPYRTLLVDALMQMRSSEGGFRDTPILGWDCGTALALLALDALEERP